MWLAQIHQNVVLNLLIFKLSNHLMNIAKRTRAESNTRMLGQKSVFGDYQFEYLTLKMTFGMVLIMLLIKLNLPH